VRASRRLTDEQRAARVEWWLAFMARRRRARRFWREVERKVVARSVERKMTARVVPQPAVYDQPAPAPQPHDDGCAR